MSERPDLRFQMQLANGSYVKAHAKLVGAKIAVGIYARRYRSFGYRAVDTETGETWAWDRTLWKLVRLK